MKIFARKVRNSIQHVLTRREVHDIRICNHSAELNQQAYRAKNNSIYFSILLSQIFFGVNNRKLERYKIYQTARVCLVAIPSLEQAKNIFIISEDCAMEGYIENNINNNNNNNNNIVRYYAAGKVRIQDVATGVGIIGYILSVNQDTHELTVHLEDNEEVIIPPPTHDINMLHWIFPTSIYDGTTHKVDTHKSICILISQLGYMLYIMHQFVCNVKTVTQRITIRPNLCS